VKTIKRIVLKNTLGIEEITLDPKQINIISGKKGTGKTSILEAIEKALSNKNIRSEFIRKGEKEASMFIELSDGTIIDRVKNLEKSDKITVKNDSIIGSPETYLRTLFNDKQFRPISFIEASTKEQNKILLGMVDIEWSMDDIKEWFGEIPENINYEQHILNILDDIQSKRGSYYLTREDKNREIKNKKAIAADILKNIPENYNAEKWRDIKLGEYYSKITKAQEHNNKITEAKNIAEGFNDKKDSIEGKYAKINADLRSNFSLYESQKREEYSSIQNRINQLKEELSLIELDVKEKKSDMESQIKTNNGAMEIDIRDLENKVKESKLIKEEEIKLEPLQEEADFAEKMKSYISEYDNAMSYHKQVEELVLESHKLTEKIEIARSLPSELLKKVKSPIEGLSVKDGVPLINGLPIQNMSTGEQLELSVEIAKKLTGELGVILVDRLESLDTDSQNSFIEACKKSGLQYFMTKVCDSEYEIVKL